MYLVSPDSVCSKDRNQTICKVSGSSLKETRFYMLRFSLLNTAANVES